MLRIAVCDDEQLFQKKMVKLVDKIVKKYGISHEIVCFSSGEELVKSDKTGFDILFLDVNMKEMDGLDTAKVIRQNSPDVFIIFVTAFITYAPVGYTVDAIRYLLKGDENFEGSLKECLDTVLERLNYKENWMVFDFQSGRAELSLDGILYIESRLHKIYFILKDADEEEFYMYEKLDNIQEKLNGRGFVRIHQSFLVNMKYIKNIERYEAELTNGTKLNISKRNYKAAESEFVRAKGAI